MGGKLFVSIGALSGFLGVALGAFGAHALQERVAVDGLRIWETAVQYHLVHALGLLVVGLLALRLPMDAALLSAGWLMVAGTVLFSGSLYALVLTDVRALGAITPFGGVAFLLGWLGLLVGAWRGL